MLRYPQAHHICKACLCKLSSTLSHAEGLAVLLQTTDVHLACNLSGQRVLCRLPAELVWLPAAAAVRCRPRLRLRHARPLPRP